MGKANHKTKGNCLPCPQTGFSVSRRIAITFTYGLVFILLLSTLQAQTTKRDSLKTDIVHITAIAKPSITNDAKKISENPETKDSVIPVPKFNYGIRPKQFGTKFYTLPINPAKMIGEPLPKLQRFMVKGGYGTYSTSFGEVYINNLRSKEYAAGLHATHLASSSTLSNAGFSGYSDNSIQLYGKKFYDKNTFSADLDYARNSLHYYGYDTKANTLEKNATEQIFNRISPSLNLKSFYTDSSKMNHDLTVGWNNLADIFSNTENHLSANGIFSKYYGKELIRVNAGVDYFNYRTPNDTFSNTIAQLNPTIISRGKKFRAHIGLTVCMDKQENTQFKFYPAIYGEYDIINHIIIPYAGVGGRLEKNSYQSLSASNPFLNPALGSYQNTDHAYEVYGGFKGSLSKNTSFDACASYSKINGAAFFVSDVTELLQNRFRLVYDTVKLISLHGELLSHYNEKYQVVLKGDYNNYTLTHLTRAWHSPEYRISLSGLYNLRDKIIARADVFVLGKQLAPEMVTVSGKTVTTSGIQELKGIADINLGLEYRYSKLLSAFVNFNNIGSGRYYRWDKYPSQKFSVLGGVSLSF